MRYEAPEIGDHVFSRNLITNSPKMRNQAPVSEGYVFLWKPDNKIPNNAASSPRMRRLHVSLNQIKSNPLCGIKPPKTEVICFCGNLIKSDPLCGIMPPKAEVICFSGNLITINPLFGLNPSESGGRVFPWKPDNYLPV
jgi:hypothetical protein